VPVTLTEEKILLTKIWSGNLKERDYARKVGLDFKAINHSMYISILFLSKLFCEGPL